MDARTLSIAVLGLLSSTSALAQTSDTPEVKPAAQAEATPLYKQAGALIEKRVADLLSRMTLEEKVAQLVANSTLPAMPGLPVGPTPAGGLLKKDGVDEIVARRVLGNGVGAFSVIDFAPTPVLQTVANENAIQDWIIKNTRLGIPTFFQGEALHGAVMLGATSFPQAVGLGSTWDRALMRQVFSVTGKEARASGLSMVLAPVFDLSRDPRYGRVEEMYSEDPYLAGEMGASAVIGLQGKGPNFDADHVIATAKHFIHGQPENGTNTAPNDFSERTMRDTFLMPFEKAVRVAHIGAVMPSYNENSGGIPSHANSWLLKDVLRKEWKFTGITNSDWFAVAQLHRSHAIAATDGDAGIQAFNAGLDMESPNGVGFAALPDAVRAGKVSQQDIDNAVARVLTLKFRAGLFEHPLTDPKRTSALVGAKAHIPLARQAADEAIVLLKNDNHVLPLDPTGFKTIAVIGPNADKHRLGGYAGIPPYYVTVLDGIRKRLGGTVNVTYAEGVRISEPDNDPGSNKMAPYKAPTAETDLALMAKALEAARSADAVVMVLGENETVTREAFGSLAPGMPASLGDTDTLELPGRQNELVRQISQLGKPTVAVLLNGRAMAIEKLNAAVPAVLEGWYLGQETGNAVAGVLFGDVNPSGKLPVSIARNVGQLPVFYYKTPQARLGYVFNDNTPLYPFGHGLSYTTFTYGKPVLDRTRIGRTETAKVSVTLTNAGTRAGDEVVQLYVHPKVSSVVQPVKRLVGFERVSLKPGQTATVSFPIGPEQLAIWDRQMRHTVEAGTVEVMVGADSAHTEAAELEISL